MPDTFICPNEGRLHAADNLRGSFTDPQFGLFRNNATLAADMDLSDLTAANFSGYAAVAAAFSVDAVIDGNGKAIILHGPCLYQKSGATANANIYGWYLFDNNTNKLIFVYKWAASKDMSDDGDYITFFPYLTVTSE